jgi:hypothetical protein
LLLATSAARFPASSPVPKAVAAALEPATVLARYAEALAALKRPPALSFEFSIEQLGLRNLEQTHLVYRSDANERDETLSVDGYLLKKPSVRIIRNRGYRYDIVRLAPKPKAYDFSFAGVARVGNHYEYSFETAPKKPASFAVTGVTIDGATFLPTVVRFHASGAATRASGRLQYAGSGRYWVVSEAVADARLADGKVAHERILWSKYRFPESLPSSTFQAPASVTPEPLAPPGGDEP